MTSPFPLTSMMNESEIIVMFLFIIIMTLLPHIDLNIDMGEGGGIGGHPRGAPIFWKTIVFCSKTMDKCDVILTKLQACQPQYLAKCAPLWEGDGQIYVCLIIFVQDCSKHLVRHYCICVYPTSSLRFCSIICFLRSCS